MTEATGGLSALRVLDASTVIAAPLVSSLLADFGADVIKVEHPGSGDPARVFEPTKDERSLSFKVTNRNKRSVTVDFHQESGVELFYRLVREVDIVVVNFRPDKLAEWKIDYADLVKHNPRLIMLHISAFGRTGPYANKPGFARIAESFAGLTHITGYPDRPPVFTGYPLADGITGYYGAFATMVAVEHRNRTGEGQLIDLALYEPVLRLMEDFVVGHGATGWVKQRSGNAQAHVVPNDVYPTADGEFVILPVSTNSMWLRLVKLLDDPELTQYESNAARLANRELIDGKVRAFTEKYPLADLLEVCAEAGLAASKINNVTDIVADPQINHRGNLTTVYDPELGTDLLMQAPVPTFSTISGEVRHPGPRLGEHTDEVLRDTAGLTDTEISALRERGTI
ncbi:formyl-CoA transferase [Tamaricihabitans halophyticus]|uniref:Formyl-CoA transferase n=1 Tax=Tamaricihabitans halophyticus TaxID=1262583 RepID=A0A4R2QVZ1_9PSEU|nr:CoA transferase [Tamaricihabitans halophyticus]TCP54260.1 formyl-CoA transferase [Tamaricihabitans halophyticus]